MVKPAYEYSASSPINNNTNISSNYQTTSADLQETVEVKITPEIKDLARVLDYNPVKIYEYMKNNFHYEPYYGSVRGAQETLRQKAGNDFDQASLLIALYRASGIPARYVYGVIRVPIEQVKSWVNIEDIPTAAAIFASNGIPSKTIMVGNEIAYVEIEHIWVEAKVPVTSYRGASPDQSGKGWVPLDPSFKKYRREGGINIQEGIAFDANALVQELESSADIEVGQNAVTNVDQELLKQRLEEYQQDLMTYLGENHSEDRLIDIFGGSVIIEEEYSILPLSLPYEVLAVREELNSLNDNYREKLTLTLRGGLADGSQDISFTASIPELIGKRISLSYVAAGKEDAELIASYLPEIPENGEIDPVEVPYTLPAYLIELVPQLILDGKVVAAGSPVTMGSRQDFYMEFSHPTADYGKDQYDITAGGNYVINLNNGRVNEEHLNDKLAAIKEMKYELENEGLDNIVGDSLTGDMLHTVAAAYYAQVDGYNQLLQNRLGIRSIRLTSVGLTSVNLNIGYLFGMPRYAKIGGLAIDLGRDFHNSCSIYGEEEQVKTYNKVSGVIGSFMEGHIFAQLFAENVEEAVPVSAIHILNYANQSGIMVYEINKNNISSVLSELEYDADTLNRFENYINAGKELAVPEREISIGEWTGTGYIIFNENGTAAYRIAGGMNGAFLQTIARTM